MRIVVEKRYIVGSKEFNSEEKAIEHLENCIGGAIDNYFNKKGKYLSLKDRLNVVDFIVDHSRYLADILEALNSDILEV